MLIKKILYMNVRFLSGFLIGIFLYLIIRKIAESCSGNSRFFVFAFFVWCFFNALNATRPWAIISSAIWLINLNSWLSAIQEGNEKYSNLQYSQNMNYGYKKIHLFSKRKRFHLSQIIDIIFIFSLVSSECSLDIAQGSSLWWRKVETRVLPVYHRI